MKKSVIRPYIIIFITIITVIQLTAWLVWRETYKDNQHRNPNKIIMTIAKFPSTIQNIIYPSKDTSRPVGNSPLIFANKRSQTQNFVCYNNYVDTGYLLLSSYDKSIGASSVRLFSLRDNKIIYRWHIDNEKLKDAAPKNADPKLFEKLEFANIHPMLTADSGLLLKVDYTMLYKIDKHSKLLWVLHGNYHHSVEADADGNYWISEFKFKNNFDTTIYKGYIDGDVVKVSPEGKVLFRQSITEALIENGYEALVFGVGPYEASPLHINDVQPALYDSKYWQKNDLLISMHNRSTIMLYRPSTHKIIWLRTGPWLNQHDVNFVSANTISIYGNDVLRDNKNIESLHGHNELYTYNFETGAISKPYTSLFSKTLINTIKSGRGEIQPDKDVIIEETNYSRVLRGNNDVIKWSYQEILDDKWVAKICWSRYYTTHPFHANKK